MVLSVAIFFLGSRAKLLNSLELSAGYPNTSAYNLGNIGLASKILRTKDLMEAASSRRRLVALRGGVRLPALGSRAGEEGLGALPACLGVSSGILPIWPVEISQ